jgi:hypothetical protein
MAVDTDASTEDADRGVVRRAWARCQTPVLRCTEGGGSDGEANQPNEGEQMREQIGRGDGSDQEATEPSEDPQDAEARRVVRTLWRCVVGGAVSLNLLVLVSAVLFPRAGWGMVLFFWPVVALLGGCAGLFVGGWVAAFLGFWIQRHKSIN